MHPEQFFPHVESCEELQIIAHAFRDRRRDVLRCIQETDECLSHPRFQSLNLARRLHTGGSVRFESHCKVPPPATKLDNAKEWQNPERMSPVMAECVRWMLLYLALGRDIPRWVPVLGALLSPAEF